MHHNNINFTKSELQAFILLYVTNADMHISDDEGNPMEECMVMGLKKLL